jgi:hypothetical protein
MYKHENKSSDAFIFQNYPSKIKNSIILKNIFESSKMDEAEQCPHCKTTKYNKPSMKLMINFCGHIM